MLHGRTRWLLLIAFCIGNIATADEAKIDQQLLLILRDVHDRGASLHNNGDSSGCYRMYQGGLLVARQMLGHRTELQKTITTGLQNAEREQLIGNRAIKLHELIEQVRAELTKAPKKAGPEQITIPPRIVPDEPKPKATIGEAPEGVVGRVLWQGKPLSEVDVTFVTLGRIYPRSHATRSGPQGVYSIAKIPAGTYFVVLSPSPLCTVKKLPERYATLPTTPIKIELTGKGEKFDLLLQ